MVGVARFELTTSSSRTKRASQAALHPDFHFNSACYNDTSMEKPLPQKTQNAIETFKRYSAPNYHPLPVVIERGEGAWVWDVEGKKYLDCLSAYSAVNQGHRHPKIVQALKSQAEKITLCSRAFHNDQIGPFLETLCKLSEMECALPMNTGAEGIETAIKAARKWGYEKKGVAEDQAEILVCDGNFHGRTTTIVSFSTEPLYRKHFGPFTPGFRAIPYGDLEALKRAITKNTVAFLYEPIQGEAGIIIPPAGFLTAAAELCRKQNVLLIDDEIQTGLGRTGKMFCYQLEKNAKPDLMVLGKALGGGVLPISAVVGPHAVLDLLTPGTHGSTFGGNSLACAVGRASLEVLIDEKLADKAEQAGSELMRKLGTLKSAAIKEVRGRGLLIGIEIDKAHGSARPYCERLMDEGVLCKETHDQVIRLAPPLAIAAGEVDFLIAKLKSVLP